MNGEITCFCGTVVLCDAFTNECPSCGQEWNFAGQALRMDWSDYELEMGFDN